MPSFIHDCTGDRPMLPLYLSYPPSAPPPSDDQQLGLDMGQGEPVEAGAA